MKKILALVLALALCLGCASALAADKVGVSMPTQDLQRWVQDGDNMKKELEANGYEVMLTYSANNVATQVADLENMITNGVKVLVVASIDGGALGDVLAKAKDAGILVIAYDRLLMGTDALSEGAHVAILADGSFLTDRIRFDADANEVYYQEGAGSVTEGYVEAYKNIVSNKFTISNAILYNDYYYFLAKNFTPPKPAPTIEEDALTTIQSVIDELNPPEEEDDWWDEDEWWDDEDDW